MAVAEESVALQFIVQAVVALSAVQAERDNKKIKGTLKGTFFVMVN